MIRLKKRDLGSNRDMCDEQMLSRPLCVVFCTAAKRDAIAKNAAWNGER